MNRHLRLEMKPTIKKSSDGHSAQGGSYYIIFGLNGLVISRGTFLRLPLINQNNQDFKSCGQFDLVFSCKMQTL